MNTHSLLPIIGKNASVTMSSREIAELTQKEHRHVVRDIETMFEQLEINAEGYAHFWTHPKNGQTYREFRLTEDLTLTLISGYSIKLRKRIIDCWQELEDQQSPKLPQTLPEALRLAADLAEQNQQQAVQIASMESYFRNGISPFEFVKGLNGVNALKIGEFLISKNWLYEHSNIKRVQSYARDRYLTEETTEIAQHGKEPFIAYKPVLLRKGAAKLYEWYSKGKLPMKKSWNGEYTQDKAVGL